MKRVAAMLLCIALLHLIACATPSAAVPTPLKTNYLESYIVERDGKKGVVDGNGKVLLPIEYARVEEVYRTREDAVYLLAAQSVPLHQSVTKVSEYGQLWHANGQKLSESSFAGAYNMQDGLIDVYALDASTQRDIHGILSSSGALLVPLQYEQCLIDGNEIWCAAKASAKEPQKVDVYSLGGSLLRSATVRYKGNAGGFVQISDETGKLYGLMDKQFHWILPAKYSSIFALKNGCFLAAINQDTRLGIFNEAGQPIIPIKYRGIDYEGGCYIVKTDSGLEGVLDASGHVLMPTRYAGINAWYDDNSKAKPHFTALSPDRKRSYLFDCTGKEQLQSSSFIVTCYRQGLIIRSYRYGHEEDRKQELADISGNILFSGRYVFSSRDGSGYTCIDKSGMYRILTAEGVPLPFPDSKKIVPIYNGLYLVYTVDSANIQRCSLFDSRGNPIKPLPFVPDRCYALSEDGTLVYSVLRGHLGLLDEGGNVLTEAIYENLYKMPGQTLLYAQTDSMHGLIDRTGRWVWSAPRKASPTSDPFDLE